MARIQFVFIRGSKERTDPPVFGDHIEEIKGKWVVIDENGKPVYSAPKAKGHFEPLARGTHN